MTQKYRKKLQKLDDENSEELISNGSAEHAISLINILLANAKENVNIISSKLSLYNNSFIISALKKALQNGVKIKLLLDNYKKSNIDSDNSFLILCQESQNCEVKTHDKQLKAHIITRDSTAFRYCDKLYADTAVASFNHPSVVANADTKVFGENGIFNNANSYKAKTL